MTYPPLSRKIVWRTLYLIYPITWGTWHVVSAFYIVLHSKELDIPLPYGMLRFQPRVYADAHMMLRDMSWIRRGTPILEIHINSPMLQKLRQQKINPYHAARADMLALGHWLVKNKTKQPYEALHARGILQDLMHFLGADVYEEPSTPRGWFEQLYEEMAILIYHPHPFIRLNEKYAPIADAWMTRNELIAYAHTVAELECPGIFYS